MKPHISVFLKSKGKQTNKELQNYVAVIAKGTLQNLKDMSTFLLKDVI